MGFIPAPTPEMGEYSIEVRRESFYLRGEDAYGKDRATAPRHGITVYPTPGDHGQGTIELLIEDIPKIRAALDQVEQIDHPARLAASPGARHDVPGALDVERLVAALTDDEVVDGLPASVREALNPFLPSADDVRGILSAANHSTHGTPVFGCGKCAWEDAAPIPEPEPGSAS